MTIFENNLMVEDDISESTMVQVLDFSAMTEHDAVYLRPSYISITGDEDELLIKTLIFDVIGEWDIEHAGIRRKKMRIRKIWVTKLPEGEIVSLMDDPETMEAMPSLFIRVQVQLDDGTTLRFSNEDDFDADTISKYVELAHYHIPARIILPEWMRELAEAGGMQ